MHAAKNLRRLVRLRWVRLVIVSAGFATAIGKKGWSRSIGRLVMRSHVKEETQWTGYVDSKPVTMRQIVFRGPNLRRGAS